MTTSQTCAFDSMHDMITCVVTYAVQGGCLPGEAPFLAHCTQQAFQLCAC